MKDSLVLRKSLGDRAGSDWLFVVATAAGSVSLGIVPVLLGLFSARYGLDRITLGYVASAENAGVLLGTVLALQWALRGWVSGGVCAGACIGVAGSLLTLLAESGSALMVLRALFGIGVGLILGLGNHALGESRLPERSFARVNVLQGLLAAFASVLLPRVAEFAGHAYALGLMALFFGVVLLAVCRFGSMPARRIPPPRQAGSRRPATAGLFALGALACFEFGAIALWSSVHAFGLKAGMPPRGIGLAVGIGGVGAIFAGLAGSRIGLGWGRVPMLVGANALMCLALLPMANLESPVQFSGALLLFNVGWTTGLIYFSGLVASLSQSAFLTGSLAFTIVASAAAAPAATVLLTKGSLLRVLPLCATACMLSLFLAFLAVRVRAANGIHQKS